METTTNMNRMNALKAYLEKEVKGNTIVEIADSVHDYIKEEVVGTGKTFKFDMYQLCENGTLTIEQICLFESELTTKFTIDNLVAAHKESTYVIVFQCKEKVKKLMELTKLQRLMFELRQGNPELVQKALAKMSDQDRAFMEEILAYE